VPVDFGPLLSGSASSEGNCLALDKVAPAHNHMLINSFPGINSLASTV